jgi:putative endonuclease
VPPVAVPRRTTAQRAGDACEQRVARYLEERGLRVLWRNYRCRGGELDIVAECGAVLVVVEVRMRSSQRFGGAAASITRAKQLRILRATRHLLACHPSLQRRHMRFDAVLVSGPAGELEWIKGAF